MHLTVTDNPQYMPRTCVLCKSADAPFVDAHLQLVNVATPKGRITTDGHLYFCIGTPENPGCAAQIGGLAGCMTPAESEAISEKLAILHGRVRDLRDQLEHEQQNRVVPVSAVVDLVLAAQG